MAQKVLIKLIDDLDGESTADETVTFAIDGQAYEIDLTSANAAKLRDALATYVASARKVAGRGSRGARRSPARAGGENRSAKIREWARSQGIQVSERGRIAADVVAKYEAAN